MRHRRTFTGCCRAWAAVLTMALATSGTARATDLMPGDPPGGGDWTVWHQTQFMIGTEDGPCLEGSGPPGARVPTSLDIARLQVAKDLGLTISWQRPLIAFDNVFDQNYMLSTFAQPGGIQTWL